MANGAPSPGGNRVQAPGGFSQPVAGGISFANNRWRTYSGHKNFDPVGDVSASGARVNQVRGVTNIRTEAKTTGVTYLWTLPTRPGGSTAIANNSTTALANFTPDVAGTYVFRVVVTFTGSDAPNTIQQDFTYVSA